MNSNRFSAAAMSVLFHCGRSPACSPGWSALVFILFS
jgi:hypothetical protein